MAAFSHSALKDFEGCARRYHEVRVLKKYPFEESAEMKYGNELHKAAELYVTNGTPLPEQFSFMQPALDVLMRRNGRKIAEQKLALRADLTPCDWWDKQVWVRGAGDLIILDDENLTAWVADWKGGSDKYPDPDQLRLMSLLVFAHYPHIRKVNAALIFVLKNSMSKLTMSVDEAQQHWWDYRERVAKIDGAHASGVWNPTSSGLCRKHCPVVTCEFNGQR